MDEMERIQRDIEWYGKWTVRLAWGAAVMFSIAFILQAIVLIVRLTR